MSFNEHITMKVDDEWYTPKSAWENIKEFIPMDKIIWEGFGNPTICGSAQYLRDLGCKKVISTGEDFLKNQIGDVLISNPPYDKKVLQPILIKMKKANQPFILILPTTKLLTIYFRQSFDGTDIQLIIPRKKIEFYKVISGTQRKGKGCSFYSLYVCYKMNLKNDINFIEG